MAEQKSTDLYDNPYKFNGKELDTETNLYYYGARYYHPRTSVWLSVDPMAEKYAGLSPYSFCANNPIAFMDYEGADWDPSNVEGTMAYGLFVNTQVGRRLKEIYTNGSLSKHTLRINQKDIGAKSGSTRISIINKDKAPVGIGSAGVNDISKDSRIFIEISVDDSKTVDDALTIGHEAFLHVEKQVEQIDRILKNPKISPEKKAEMIRKVYNDGFIRNPQTDQLIKSGPGDVDHAKILNKSNPSYESYKSQLFNILDPKGRNQLDKSIKQSFNQYYKDAWIRWQAKVGEYENR